MNDLQVFNGQFGSVRTMEENGRVLFCGNDVARALGFEKTRNAIQAHCRYALKRGVPHPQNQSKLIEMTFIPESDVYRLAFQSKLPGAEKFTDWVTEEVLPAIRQKGYYAPDMTAVITQAVQMAVEQTLGKTIEILMPMVKESVRQDARKGVCRRVHGSIYSMDIDIQAEIKDMILEGRMTYQGICDYLWERYGISISKSSVHRYASKLYDTVEEAPRSKRLPPCMEE